ncbi:MAG: DUF1272 domain-containing protein [Hyphomicrobiaceae bacterium]
MLELRPNCEFCDKDLPADAPDAMICSYECTFCATCVADQLEDVCPNCGGGFCPRPIRPKTARREGVSRVHQQPSTQRVHLKYDRENVRELSARTKDIPPNER